jgi:hypothetical protein
MVKSQIIPARSQGYLGTGKIKAATSARSDIPKLDHDSSGRWFAVRDTPIDSAACVDSRVVPRDRTYIDPLHLRISSTRRLGAIKSF